MDLMSGENAYQWKEFEKAGFVCVCVCICMYTYVYKCVYICVEECTHSLVCVRIGVVPVCIFMGYIHKI